MEHTSPKSQNRLAMINSLLFFFVEKIRQYGMTNDIGEILTNQKLNKELIWLKSFKTKTLIWAIIPALLFVGSITCTVFAVKDVKIKSVKALKTKKYISRQIKIPLLKTAGGLLALLVISNLLIMGCDPVHKKTKKLKDILKSGSDKDRECLWLPIGTYIDITGGSISNYITNDAIWGTMNLRVDKNYSFESPRDRTKVLFMSTFEFARDYNYDKVDL